MPILQLRSQLDLHTRCENQVENEISREPVRAGDRLYSERLKTSYPNGRHRPVEPSRKYNCHGLTFAARRTWIWKPSEIAKILKDDEYERINVDDVLPGDIAVYYTNGDAEHSGVVVNRGEIVPIVVSKWGPNHEVIHRVHECPYDAAEILYYRIRT